MRAACRSIPAFFALAGLLAWVAGCASTHPPVAADRPPERDTPSRSQLMQATVVGVYNHEITLVDGVHEGSPAVAGAASRPILRLWAATVVYGDVDGVPGEEAVAMLSAGGGGSGEFVYVAVFGSDGTRARTLAIAEVGDRVRLDRLWLEDRGVRLDLIQPGPGEPACCGTERVRRTYGWTGAGLQLLRIEPAAR
jgi:hypothetical protein